MNTTPPLPSRSTYVQTVLKAYLDLPETPLRSRPADRRLVPQLYDRALPLKTIQTALLLASARRLTREPQAPPLQPIRSLHYFIPVIEEVLSLPPTGQLPSLPQTEDALSGTHPEIKLGPAHSGGTRPRRRVFRRSLTPIATHLGVSIMAIAKFSDTLLCDRAAGLPCRFFSPYPSALFPRCRFPRLFLRPCSSTASPPVRAYCRSLFASLRSVRFCAIHPFPQAALCMSSTCSR